MATVTFIGAGSVEFTRELLIDLLSFPELGDLRLSLHDIDPERLETAEAIARDTADQLGASPTIITSLDRRRALEGASYVINCIQVGMHAATVRDFEIPAKYGLRQTIGDTLGVGGIFRGLRTFPVLDGLARDMLDVAPDAWLLNYTNPMAMNIAYLAEAHPTLKAVGLCHSVYWTVHDLCRIVEVPLEQVSYASAGVNHQAWLLDWSRDGESLYPLLDKAIERDPELTRRVRFDLYQRLGYFPTETSEHSSEYVAFYLRHDDEIERLRIPVGEYVRISEANLETYARTRAALAAGQRLPLVREATEYAPLVIHAMETGTTRTIVGNVANRGLITNLPEGYCVEVPCTVDVDGVTPQPMGALPAHLAAVNRPFCSVGELTVRAAIDGDPAMIRRAALVDPNTAATLTAPQIWALCDDLVAAHGDLLPPALRWASLMPLVPTAALVERAQAHGDGLAAFNVICLEHVEAVIAGAERADRPVILQVSENALRFHNGAVAPLAQACVAAARSAGVDVAMHLDHVKDLSLLDQVMPWSFGSVMVDASALSYADNVAKTRRAVAWARRLGLWVEAELGQVGGKDGEPALDAHSPGARTDPGEAAAFVAATGVDALAVAVGSSHAMTAQTAVLDLDLVARLRAAVPVPLVLHGSSGVAAATLTAAVAAGIVKVNIGTALNVAFTGAVRATLAEDSGLVDPRRYLAPARDAMAEVVAEAVRSLSPAPPSALPAWAGPPSLQPHGH